MTVNNKILNFARKNWLYGALLLMSGVSIKYGVDLKKFDYLDKAKKAIIQDKEKDVEAKIAAQGLMLKQAVNPALIEHMIGKILVMDGSQPRSHSPIRKEDVESGKYLYKLAKALRYNNYKYQDKYEFMVLSNADVYPYFGEVKHICTPYSSNDIPDIATIESFIVKAYCDIKNTNLVYTKDIDQRIQDKKSRSLPFAYALYNMNSKNK